jgi:hypothetical protein
MFYKNFVDFLVKYEEVNTTSAKAIGNTSVEEQNVTLLTGDGKKVDLKDKLQLMVSQPISLLKLYSLD